MNKKILAVAGAVAGVLAIAGVSWASTSGTPAGWPSGKPMFCVNRGTNTVVFNYARNSFCAEGTYPLDSSGYVPNVVVPVVTPTVTATPSVVNVVTVYQPLNVDTTVAMTVTFTVHATDSARHELLTFAISGQPHGVHINSRTGVVTGNMTSLENSRYVVKVTATDSTGATDSATFHWTVDIP